MTSLPGLLLAVQILAVPAPKMQQAQCRETARAMYEQMLTLVDQFNDQKKLARSTQRIQISNRVAEMQKTRHEFKTLKTKPLQERRCGVAETLSSYQSKTVSAMEHDIDSAISSMDPAFDHAIVVSDDISELLWSLANSEGAKVDEALAGPAATPVKPPKAKHSSASP